MSDLRRIQEWPLLAALEPLGAKERVGYLCSIALKACAQEGFCPCGKDELELMDTRTCKLSRILFKAIADVEFLPLTEMRKGYLFYREGTDKAREIAVEKVMSAIAEMATSLYACLLDHRTPLLERAGMPGALAVVHPTHLKTRALLANVIAEEWSETSDGEKASRLMDFLVGACEGAKQTEYITIIREALTEHCRVATLERLVSGMKAESSPDILGVLSREWSGRLLLTPAISALAKVSISMPHEESSLRAWELVVEYARVIAQLDSKARQFIQYVAEQGIPAKRWRINHLNPSANSIALALVVSSGGTESTLESLTSQVNGFVSRWRTEHSVDIHFEIFGE